jgi:tetratricopeptide (TPR) repeat protein
MALVKTDPVQARARFEEALALFRKISNRANMQWILLWLGRLDEREGHLAAARADNEEVASIARGIVGGEREFFAASHANLAAIAVATGDLDASMRAADVAMPIFSDMGHRIREARLLLSIADVHLERGALELAEPVLDAALARFHETNGDEGERQVEQRRARIQRARGDIAGAGATLRACLEGYRRAKDPVGAAWTTLELAELRADAELSAAHDTTARSVVEEPGARATSLEDAIAAWRTLEEHHILDGAAWGEAVIARAHLLAGHRSDARAHAESALEKAQPLESRVVRLRAVANAAHVLAAIGEARRARSILMTSSSEAARLGLAMRDRELRRLLK